MDEVTWLDGRRLAILLPGGPGAGRYEDAPAGFTGGDPSVLDAVADDVIELPGVGAASLDLFVDPPEQTYVVEEQAPVVQMDATDTRETTGDGNRMHLTTTGTFDFVRTCHFSTPL